jgi:ABC-2 type transport system permease protein
MPSKTSWLNKQLIQQTVRSSGWIPIIYFLGLLFALPLDIYNRYANDKRINFQPQQMENIFQYNLQIQVALLIIVPVIMAVFLFRFLHVKQAAEMMHSLPLKREKIFYHYTLSGIVGLIVPVVFTAFIVLILYQLIDLSAYFQMADIFIWAGTSILLNVVLFTAGVFVAMMTGISVVQVVLTYILLLFPAGFMALLVSNLHFLWFGFPMDYYLNSNIVQMSPLTFIAVLDESILHWKITAAYAAASLILYGLSLYLYKKRKIESASEAIAIPKLRSVFKYGMAFCFTLLGGVYFAAISEANLSGWLIFGYCLGAVIGYYVAEMVLQKTWRVFRKFKGLLIYGGIMAVVLTGFQVIGTYENHVPEQNEIQHVFFTDTPYVFSNNTYYGVEFIPEPLKEQSNIKAVRKLHQQIIENKELVKSDESQYKEQAFFYYELKNGRKMIRQYSVDREKFADSFANFQESEEYKRTSQVIFHLDSKGIDFFSISTQGPFPDRVTVNNREDIEEFIKIYQKDVLAASYDDNIYYQNYGASVEFFIDQQPSVYLPLSPSYKGALQWLKEKGLLDLISAMPEDVSSIQIVKDDAQYLEMDPREIAAEIEGRTDAVKIEDKKQISELLQRTTGWLQKHQYIAVIHYSERKQVDVMYMDDSHAPEFVKEHFR